MVRHKDRLYVAGSFSREILACKSLPIGDGIFRHLARRRLHVNDDGVLEVYLLLDGFPRECDRRRLRGSIALALENKSLRAMRTYIALQILSTPKMFVEK